MDLKNLTTENKYFKNSVAIAYRTRVFHIRVKGDVTL